MFTQPVVPTLPGPQHPQQHPSGGLPRQSRLRRLSYLRNYTHNPFLSRDSSQQSTHSHHSNGSNHSNNSSGRNSPPEGPSPGGGGGVFRTVSYSAPAAPSISTTNSHTPTNSNGNNTATATTTTTTSRAARSRHRLTLVAPSDPGLLQGFFGPSSPPPPVPQINPEFLIDAAIPQRTNSIAQAENIAHVVEEATTTLDVEPPTMRRASEANVGASEALPSIRFSAYYDPRSTRPSLSFPPISRTLVNGNEIIRVGRYSERDTQTAATLGGTQQTAGPVGFKSKVVSRRHCEFWCEDGKWYIKDVKSSSGTFLNHIRLSPPSQESKAFPVNDGDIVQLGIDFKGGEEMIFRCVKMRLELNRGWQTKPNSFNVAAHKRLRNMASSNAAASAASGNTQDCSICLNSIAPCQSLFVAPCSHTWHFKCVRSLLTSPQYPIFICPNCRAGADLEADVEEPNEEWENLDDFNEENDEHEEVEGAEEPAPSTIVVPAPPTEAPPVPPEATLNESDVMDLTVNINTPPSPSSTRLIIPHAISEPLPIRPIPGSNHGHHLGDRSTPSPPSGAEGPITPRNNAGPWVFDGMAGRRVDESPAEMTNLDAAAEMGIHALTHDGPSDDASSR